MLIKVCVQIEVFSQYLNLAFYLKRNYVNLESPFHRQSFVCRSIYKPVLFLCLHSRQNVLKPVQSLQLLYLCQRQKSMTTKSVIHKLAASASSGFAAIRCFKAFPYDGVYIMKNYSKLAAKYPRFFENPNFLPKTFP